MDQLHIAAAELRHPDTDEILNVGVNRDEQYTMSMRCPSPSGTSSVPRRLFFTVAAANLQNLHLQGHHQLDEVDVVVQRHEVLQVRGEASVVVAPQANGILALGWPLGWP